MHPRVLHAVCSASNVHNHSARGAAQEADGVETARLLKYVQTFGAARAALVRKLRAESGGQRRGHALTRTDRAAGAGKRLGCCREQAPRARSDGALRALGPHDWIFRGVVRAGHAQEGRKAEEGVLAIFKLAT